MEKIIPYLRQTLWAGDKAGKGIGEAYLFSALTERPSRSEKGTPLFQWWGGDVPLIKYIDAKGALSVQVHPKTTADRQGKDELWIVDDLYPDAAAYIGFRRDVTKEEVRRCCADGSILSLMQRIPLQTGDMVYIPGGTIHAVRGVAFFEVQHSLDVTYRLFDYGRGREISLDAAMEHLNFRRYEETATDDFFAVAPLSSKKNLQKTMFQDTVVVVKRGTGILNGRSVGPRDCYVLSEGEKLCFSGMGELLLTPIRILRKFRD
ncbi:MAG: class I mannose-6-phosphate isomerase [Firmicutes bacterium]|nr:class I mannose-6-phosphate isomerase [Bacillota bacterium]